MKIFIGGLVAVVAGLIGLIAFWEQFWTFLAGAIPLLLLVSGGLAIYLSYEEIKDKFISKKETTGGKEEGYKEEVERLKAEIDELKKSKETE